MGVKRSPVRYTANADILSAFPAIQVSSRAEVFRRMVFPRAVSSRDLHPTEEIFIHCRKNQGWDLAERYL